MTNFTQVPDKANGDVFTEAMWDTYIKDNLNKLMLTMHRQVTVAQFLALTGVSLADEAYVIVDDTNGIVWHLRYNLATTDWRFLGGAPLYSEVLTDETSSSSGYQDLGTVGPSITVPLDGDYDIEVADTGYDTVNNGQNLVTALKMGATATADADSFSNTGAAASPGIGASRRYRKTSVTASTVLKVQYKRANATSHWANRTIQIRPARID